MNQLLIDVDRDEDQLSFESEDREQADWGDIDRNGDLLPRPEAA
jgi:hypothetical protein